MFWRLCKIVLVAAVALWVTLVAVGNISDYGTNLAFVRHVLAMDTIFPDSGITWRAIHSPTLQFIAYDIIIAIEALTALLLWVGVVRLWQTRRDPNRFQPAKCIAAAGLTLGILLWLVGFIVIGGEWFGMWMSAQWNGIASAFRFTLILVAVLIFLAQREADE